MIDYTLARFSSKAHQKPECKVLGKEAECSGITCYDHVRSLTVYAAVIIIMLSLYTTISVVS